MVIGLTPQGTKSLELANPSHTWWTAALALALMLAAFSTEGAAQSREALILQQQSAATYQRRLSQASPLARPPSSSAVAPAPGLNVLNRPQEALTSKLSEERQVRPFGANLFTAGGGIESGNAPNPGYLITRGDLVEVRKRPHRRHPGQHFPKNRRSRGR